MKQSLVWGQKLGIILENKVLRNLELPLIKVVHLPVEKKYFYTNKDDLGHSKIVLKTQI